MTTQTYAFNYRQPQYKQRKPSGFIVSRKSDQELNRDRSTPGFIRVSEKSLERLERIKQPILHNNYLKHQPKGSRNLDDQSSNSSSSFQKFELETKRNQYDYETNKLVKKYPQSKRQRIEQSSFQLSPYKHETKFSNSSYEQEDPQDSQSFHQNLDILQKYRNTIIKQVSEEEQQSVDLPKERNKKNMFQQSSNFSKKISDNRPPTFKKQKKQDSSSDFSLDSDEIVLNKKPFNDSKPPLPISKKHSTSNYKQQNNNNNKDLRNSSRFFKNSKKGLQQKSLTTESQNQDQQIQNKESSEQEQLIMEYDTKEFKGGSIKDRILDYKNKLGANHSSVKKMQHLHHMNKHNQNSESNIHINHNSHHKNSNQKHNHNNDSNSNPNSNRNHHHINNNSNIHHQHNEHTNRSHQKNKEINRQNSRNSQRNIKDRKKKQQSSQQELQVQHNSPKAMMFQIDVKKKNLTLAEAFEMNCSRLKRKLENQRQEFKRGAKTNYSQQNDHRKLNINRADSKSHLKNTQPMIKRVVESDQKAERLAMGIKAPVTRKQMYDMTKKNYKQLPEVKKKVNEEKKKQDLMRRLQNVKKLDRQVRLRLRYGN